ncbi:MAG: phosphotransferase family protein [Acidobacteria bacterium]|nr:phosphotransferase family protein [Acidobacteriota bacterium]
MTPEDRRSLAAALGDHLGVVAEVRDVHRLSSGASRLTWVVDVELGGVPRQVVVQRERPGGTRSASGMASEAALLRDAAVAGVPVAAVLACDRVRSGGDPLGAWIALGLVDGETVPRRILRDEHLAGAREVLLGQCAAALVAIHGIPPSEAHGLSATDQVAEFRAALDLFGDPQPVFELAFRWLERRRPEPTSAPSVVHGDFRLGNIVVGEDGLRAVLDWELAHLGDPVEDLGWFTSRAWRFGSDRAAAGLGGLREFLDAYRDAGGSEVSPESLRWWQVLATLKWGIMCIVQASAHQRGASRSVELAAIGRRVAETQEDLLELIDGPSSITAVRPPAASARPPGWAPLGGPGGPTVRPGGDELLAAVGEFLAQVRDEVPGRSGFHARVAANVVAQLERELVLGPLIADRHRARLAALGADDDEALVGLIRDGAFADDDRVLLDALRAATRDTLAVVNPGYALGAGGEEAP